MMTATAALETGTVTLSTRIKDIGTLRLDNGRTKIDDADRKGMGWMTFEDGVAYSRNVVAAKVALGLGKTTRESSAILYDTWLSSASAQPTGIDVAGEVAGHRPRPGPHAVARRSTWPTAPSARASRSRRSSSRRRTRRWSTAARSSSRTWSRRSATHEIEPGRAPRSIDGAAVSARWSS